MSLESFQAPSQERRSAHLADKFKGLRETHEDTVFDTLEHDLLESGFAQASEYEVVEIFNNNSLVCRSESFSKVMDLLLESSPIEIKSTGDANMCIVASGSGFRVAMQEGFSGRDVNGLVKTVITFKSDHLKEKNKISKTNDLWNTKPETAQVSLSGDGEIFSDDVVMVTFRFPIQYFPNRLLTESEKDLLEEDKIRFIVRHYTQYKEKTMQ